MTPATPMGKTTGRTMNVLVLCTGNSARSILAEALFNHHGQGRVQGFSAGSRPTGRVNPMALRVLQEAGMSEFEPRSKSWDEFARHGAPTMDLVITVCASAAGESCPVWPGAPLRAHWGLPDPAAVEGTEDIRLGAFREAFGVLQYRVRQCLALPLADMDAAHLARRLAEIGESLPGDVA